MPDETEQWFARFLKYLNMGQKRSLMGVFNMEREAEGKEKATGAPGSWSVHAEKFKWKQRAGRFDRYQNDLHVESLKEQAKEFQETRMEMAKKLRDRVEKMLEFPLAESTTTEDGKTVLMPAKWSMSDVTRMAKASDALMNDALSLNVSNLVHDATTNKYKVEDKADEDSIDIDMLAEYGFADDPEQAEDADGS